MDPCGGSPLRDQIQQVYVLSTPNNEEDRLPFIITEEPLMNGDLRAFIKNVHEVDRHLKSYET